MEGFESFVGVDFWTALFTFINMMITFLVLKALLFKPVRKMIDDRQNEIDGLYAKADVVNAEAAALKAEYEDKLKEAMAERDVIIKDANERGRKREEEIVSSAKEQASKLLEKAQSDIALEKEKALEDVKNDISELAVSIAEKVTEKEINADDQQQLVSSFIDALGN